jgi:hypothetical protein
MRRNFMFAALIIVLAFLPIMNANATLITKDEINILRIYDYGQDDYLCDPCGPSTVSHYDDPMNAYSFDWFGSAGFAHDAYNQALAEGTDIYDERADNALDENDWLDAHPDALVINNGEGDDGIFIVIVYQQGDVQDVLRDFIDLSYYSDGVGMWYTSAFLGSDGFGADFQVVAPSPAPVPEPGTIAILLLGALATAYSAAGGRSAHPVSRAMSANRQTPT